MQSENVYAKQFRERVENQGGKVTGEYKNNKTPVKCLCKNNHICRPKPNNIQNGQGMCKICAEKDLETAKKNFYNNIEHQGGKVTGEYKNNKTPVKCLCKNNHICRPKPNHIQNGQGMCKICAEKDLETAKKNFYNNIDNQGGKVTGEYKNAHTPVKCLCKNNHICRPRPNSIRKGQGMCKICTQTLGEYFMEEALKKLELNPIYQYIHPSIPKLRFDYAVMVNNKIQLLEFDGEQHFKSNDLFHRQKGQFEYRRQLDLLKMMIAKRDGIKMIRIDYTWTKKPLEEWISYLREKIYNSEMIVADSELYNWINDPVSDKIINKYIIKPKLIFEDEEKFNS